MTHTDSEAILLVEYQAAHDAYLHYDGFRWQAGSFLIAGVFIFWGLLAGESVKPEIAALANSLVAVVMSAWLLYAHHGRQIYLSKLDRLQELEYRASMEQHLRFVDLKEFPRRYRVFGPKGHILDMILYSVAVLGGSLISLAQQGPSPWQLVPAPLLIGTLIWAGLNESRLQSHLDTHGGSPARAAARNAPKHGD